MEISLKNARAWSRMGPRAVYGQFLQNLASGNTNIIALSADLGRSSGLDRFSKELPSQFMNVGIAEQNLVGISSGVARTGLIPFASTFAPFASLRASEQVRMNMGYMQEPVNLVALASGFALGFLGNSHFGIEDIAVMRSIPGITILSPADCAELLQCLRALVDYNKPVYLRLTGGVGMPIVYESEYDFQIGKSITLHEGNEVLILSHGTTVGHCLQALKSIHKKGINAGLINMHTIKPLDECALHDCLGDYQRIYVFEEHTVIGGLGSTIVEFINDNQYKDHSVIRVGVKDCFPKSGSYDYMLDTLGLNALRIEERILRDFGFGE